MASKRTSRKSARRVSRPKHRRTRHKGGGLAQSYKTWCANLKAQKAIIDNTVKFNKIAGDKSRLLKLKRGLVQAKRVVCRATDNKNISTNVQKELIKTGDMIQNAVDQGLISRPAAGSLLANTKNLITKTQYKLISPENPWREKHGYILSPNSNTYKVNIEGHKAALNSIRPVSSW